MIIIGAGGVGDGNKIEKELIVSLVDISDIDSNLTITQLLES